MNYKVIIDASHGGDDLGNSGNGLVEKDFSLLVSNYIKKRLDDLRIANSLVRNVDRDIELSERVSIINSLGGNNNKVIVLSNHLNNETGEGAEVVYALRNNDKLASLIAQEITNSIGVFDKYYQLRDPLDTKYDYYDLVRDTPNYETIIVDYGSVNNVNDANRLKSDYEKYGEAIVRALSVYTGNKYVPISDNYYVVKSGDSLWKIATSYGISVDSLKSANNLTSNILSIGQVLNIPMLDQNIYIVKSGDSLWKIANSYGISVDSLKSANNLTSNILSIGQELVIPEDSSLVVYIVKSGDSLWKIANSYGISVDSLKSANNLTSNILSIGQELIIPDVTSQVVYIVKSGDSLWKIASSYGISVDSLKNANDLTSNILSIGQELIIPRT